MLVQRVSAAGVVTKGIQAAHVEDTSGAFQVSGLLTEPVVPVVEIANPMMGHPTGPRSDLVGTCGAVLADRDPAVSSTLPGHPQRTVPDDDP